MKHLVFDHHNAQLFIKIKTASYLHAHKTFRLNLK